MHTKIEGGGEIEVFKILNGYENIDSNIYFKWKELIEKHYWCIIVIWVDCIFKSIHYLRGPFINRLDAGERAE